MESVDGFPVGVVRFTEPLEVLSCAVMNGGVSTASALFIMQVPKDYNCDFPERDTLHVREALGLPEDSLGMMTAAEVDYVFNVREVEYEGVRVAAVATAGLSNHVVAGEALDDYDEKRKVSARRVREMTAGTINVAVVSPLPMTMEGKVNFLIPLVEAKSVAMAEHGFRETGTTSDAMAVLCPRGDGAVSWTGTGSVVGIAAARAVSAAVGHALDVRNEHPAPIRPEGVLRKMGLSAEDLRAMSGAPMSAEEYEGSLRSLMADPEVAAVMDMAWTLGDRVDSLAQDGDWSQMGVMLDALARCLGTEPVLEGSLVDCAVAMLARRAGGLRWPAARSRRWCPSSPFGSRTSPRRTWTRWSGSSTSRPSPAACWHSWRS